jgi:hypothetical protein
LLAPSLSAIGPVAEKWRGFRCGHDVCQEKVFLLISRDEAGLSDCCVRSGLPGAGEARAVSCDEFVKFLNTYNLEAGGLPQKLEAYGPSEVCRFGREVGFPFLKKAITNVKEFTACPKYGPLAVSMLDKLQENLTLQETRAVKDCSE